MKYLTCQNNDPTSKYFKGRQCYEKVLVDEFSKAVLCWKCTAIMTPPPEEKKISGYPRGWKFMSEFVDKVGNVYHKGELQPELFGTLQPSEIKESSKKRKKKITLDDKIENELSKRISANKSKKLANKLVKKTTRTKRS